MAPQSPERFRRRLTAAFVVVAAVGAGVLAVLAFLLAREYRWLNFREQTDRETRVALALAPRELDAASFERLRQEYEARSEANIVAIGRIGSFSSSPDLGADDIPHRLLERLAEGGRQAAEVTISGRSFHVVGAVGAGGTTYFFFFALDQLEDSLDEFARACGVAWVITVVLAGAVGRSVARRTLRPVSATAAAAEAIAAGQRGTRLPAGDDEFGALAASFNRMADDVERTIAELERSAERERRFTADVAHDLRTPLTGMAASASLLADRLDDVPPSLRRPVALLVADIHRLRTLCQELLELSRLDAGTEPVNRSMLRIGPAAEASLRALGSRVDLDLAIHADGDAAVIADPRRLGRILANVFANAATHGGGRATVEAHREDGWVVVDIVDDGPGIPDSELATVFDRFAKSDRARAGGGSGLGLAIARAHALAQGGDLEAANVPGRGARFTLRLPAATA